MNYINNTKTKYITKDSKDRSDYWKINYKKSNLIDNESSLLTPAINSKDKMQIKLKDNINPMDYNLSYYNELNNDNLTDNFYYTNINKGAGRGFGNLTISTNIRNGNDSRNDNKDFKGKKEEQLFFDYQFNYLDKNFQNPDNVVLPFPRGGETTRKQNQLFTSNNNNNKLIFNY